MKNLIFKILRIILRRLGILRVRQLMCRMADLMDTDLITLAYQSMGILNYQDAEISGEKFVVEKILIETNRNSNPVLLDVGANIGEYSDMLHRKFPTAQIYAFEPNQYTFKLLTERLGSLSVNCVNMACGSKSGKERVYAPADNSTSGFTSIYKESINAIHKVSNVLEIETEIITLDDFCREEGITFIDLLKIDTEGHELKVLLGARGLIKADAIEIIQFEFNEMNIFSRVFLHDFYELLSGFNIYRIDSNKLININTYNTNNEIFKFQNLLAMRKNSPRNLDNKYI